MFRLSKIAYSRKAGATCPLTQYSIASSGLWVACVVENVGGDAADGICIIPLPKLFVNAMICPFHHISSITHHTVRSCRCLTLVFMILGGVTDWLFGVIGFFGYWVFPRSDPSAKHRNSPLFLLRIFGYSQKWPQEFNFLVFGWQVTAPCNAARFVVASEGFMRDGKFPPPLKDRP